MEDPASTLADSAVLRASSDLPDTALKLLARVNGFTELHVFVQLGLEDRGALIPAASHLLNLGLVEDIR